MTAYAETLARAIAAVDRAKVSQVATSSALAEAQAALEEALGLAAAPTVAPTPAIPSAPSPGATAGLSDPKAFFDAMRATKVLGPVLDADEVSGCEAIHNACAGHKPTRWTAYALATAFLETAGTMQPISEYGGPSYFRKMYDIEGARPDKARELGNLTPGDGVKFHGRGYVQLTGRRNYLKAGAELGVDLIADPEAAKRPDVAAGVMVRGMIEGWFTTKKLGDYINNAPDLKQFTNARRIINGQDRAADVAGYAMTFLAALKAGGWR